MPNTPDRNYPYPNASDSADVPYYLQALAEAVEEDMNDTIAVPVTITTANAIDWSGARVRKIGNRVYFDGRVSRASDITAGLSGGTVPVGARPAVDQVVPSVSMTSGYSPASAAMTVNASGSITLNFVTAPAASRYVSFSFSYEVA